jgi:hypothetical protein
VQQLRTEFVGLTGSLAQLRETICKCAAVHVTTKIWAAPGSCALAGQERSCPWRLHEHLPGTCRCRSTLPPLACSPACPAIDAQHMLGIAGSHAFCCAGTTARCA